MNAFESLGLAPSIQDALARAKLSDPTPIQAKAIPLALDRHDIMGLAQTGTGKTLAFGLPLIHHLLQEQGKREPKTARALILAPTRELAQQITDSLRAVLEKMHLKVATVVGGQSINRHIKMLEKGTDILVATPGRLIDLMNRDSVRLGSVKYLVLDEADQMLDMGFIHDLRKIEPQLGTPRQTMLFSATMPKLMEEISKSYLVDPQRVQVSPPGKAADKIEQSVHFMSKITKPRMLREVLSADLKARTLVFARTKHGAEKIMKQLVKDGYNAASIHGNKSQGQRERAIKAFKSGEITILIATDVAARGIDIPDVGYVINYELPEVPDNYVHRIGRTARAGREGRAIAFCAPEEVKLLKQIQKLMKFTIPVASGRMPDPSEIPDAPTPARGQRRRGGGRQNSGAPQGAKPQGGPKGNPNSKGGKPKGQKRRRPRTR